MRREIFEQDHELFRGQVKRFLEKEVVPKISHWNETGICDRETWRRLGAQGLVAPSAPVEYGGSGADFLYDAIVIEELAYVRAHALMVSLHSGVCLPYIATFGSEEQKRKYLPGAVSGEILLGICMSEPAAGSDLQNIRTTAVRDGDDYVLNGSKTFISHGQLGDLFIVAAKTDPKAAPAHTGISLILVEATAPGFRRGRKLDKIGLRGQDTSEIFFEDCRVPRANLLGAKEGLGFPMLMEKLQQERLVISVAAIVWCRRALEDTVAYVKERRAFGRTIADFQNTQFRLAELATEVEIGQSFVDRLLAAHVRGEEIVGEVSMAKWWTTDLLRRLTGQCLQLHGGYGFMREYAISEDYADAAVQTIYAGTNEIMKVIIARRMGLSS